jgi:hypothetical protein
MQYRVVLIFPDTESLADFIAQLEVLGEVNGQEYTFVGILSEGQIRTARQLFNAYVRVVRELE